ncbi:hypothetical protein GCM10022255_054710 [Dactylosporangium darangshiense]|uniref:Uncharacterized protein n=1 Tax=Dactylosporangium darangshiense TaxID=579108 RepID=A0ABP8DDR5_9ACTN
MRRTPNLAAYGLDHRMMTRADPSAAGGLEELPWAGSGLDHCARWIGLAEGARNHRPSVVVQPLVQVNLRSCHDGPAAAASGHAVRASLTARTCPCSIGPT